MSTKEERNTKILIVDDNPRNIEVVAGLLSGQNYAIEFADSGEQALEWTAGTVFDLILMDIMMPGMNGYETCRKIKEKDVYKETPVIFLTAKTDTESLAKAFAAGGVDYIEKPFRAEELLARVATHIELKQRRQELKLLNDLLEKKVRERTRELEEANKKLTIALKDLQKLDATKNDFLHMVSHELRTPLNGILGGVELLKMHDLPGELNEYLEILDVSTRRLEKFSYQALNISQLQATGLAALKLELFSLPEFLQDFLKRFRKEQGVAASQLLFSSTVNTGTVKADSKYLDKLCRIILENALEYTGNRFPVRVTLKKEQGKFVCAVQDKGPGFPQSMLEASMLSFTPGIRHSDRKTGLNLHFARMIIHYFEGELQLSNTREGGALVRLIFPVFSETSTKTEGER